MQIFLKIFLFLNFLVCSKAYSNLTLKEAFEAAKKNMETLKISETQIDQSIEQKNRAKGLMLPFVSGVGSYTRIDPPFANGPNSPFLLTQQHSAAIRLNQPLIRGGAIENYRLAKENIQLAKFQRDATELNLFQLVIVSYYNLASAQLDVQNLEELVSFSKERVNEVKNWARIGKSRASELAEVEAQYLSAVAQHKQGLVNLKQAEQNFEFFTQLPISNLTIPSKVPELSSSVAKYLDRIKTRPDLKVADKQVEVAERSVKIAKGGHYPALDFVGNYYITRTGILEDAEWDIGLSVSIPLFQGGTVQASVNEAVANKKVSELNSAQLERAAQRDIITSYHNLSEMRSQLLTLIEAVKKYESSYNLNKRDYKLGSVTNLNVLQAMNLYIQAKRTYNNLLSMAHMTHNQLLASAGELPK
jgi:outer membrane protein